MSQRGSADHSPAFGDLSAGLSGIRLQPVQQSALCEDVGDTVRLALRLWPGYDLAGEGILINTGEEMYALGFREAILRRVFRTSGASRDQAVTAVTCGEPSFFRIAVRIETVSSVLFIFGHSGHGDSRLNELAELHGQAFLYVEMRAFDLAKRGELRRTIVHEGAHLFLQGAEALQGEPEYCLATSSSACGRPALERLYSEDSAFRRSVHRELCAARRFDEIRKRLESHDRPEDAERLREDLAMQLNLMTNERQQRGERYGTAEIEAFWYALEGVPSYLEEVAAREAGAPYGFATHLPETCEADPPLSYFYPLSNGAILWYAIDLLEGGDQWKSPTAFLSGGYRELFFKLRHEINRD